MESCIIRGGWYLDEICKYFWYLKKSDHINNAGRAIAGFHDAHLKVFSPSLGFIRNKNEEQKAFNYGISLFSGAGIEQLNHPSLIGYKKVMIASLLENFDNVLQEYGLENILVQSMYKNAELHGISLAKRKEWGKQIRSERAILNG